MKYFFIIRFILVIFFFTFFNNAIAENKIAFIDLNYIFTKSLAGKSINTQLKKAHQSSLEKFKKIEESLKDEESAIIGQKNILNKEDYQKKITQLRTKVSDYRTKRNSKLKDLTIKRNKAKKELLSIINPMLTAYSNANSISIIIPKENIIIGKSELDITKNILQQIDEKIKTIKIN